MEQKDRMHSALLPFFNKKPLEFQRAFHNLFRGAKSKEDVIILTKKIFDLMWYRLRNGRVVHDEDIYRLWGPLEKPSLSSKKSKHHFPPESRDSEAWTIAIAENLHRNLHDLFMNLYKDEELLLFLQALFICDGINTKKDLWDTADRVKEIVEKKEGRL